MIAHATKRAVSHTDPRHDHLLFAGPRQLLQRKNVYPAAAARFLNILQYTSKTGIHGTDFIACSLLALNQAICQ